mgnify:CR=1 FL=1
MDFKTAQPIIDAVRERAEQGIFGYTSRPEEYFKLIAKWQQRQNGYLPDVIKWRLRWSYTGNAYDTEFVHTGKR